MTDRHRQIGKWVAQNYKYICHQKLIFIYLSIYLSIFSVTYMTYGMVLNVRILKYKVTSVGTGHFKYLSLCFCFLNYLAVAKRLKTICQWKECQEDLVEWQQSVINHLYWALISTASGDGELIVEKWKSIERHIQNLHRGRGGKLQRCAHSRLRGKHLEKMVIRQPGVTECHYWPILSPVGQSIWEGLGIHVGHFIIKAYTR